MRGLRRLSLLMATVALVAACSVGDDGDPVAATTTTTTTVGSDRGGLGVPAATSKPDVPVRDDMLRRILGARTSDDRTELVISSGGGACDGGLTAEVTPGSPPTIAMSAVNPPANECVLSLVQYLIAIALDAPLDRLQVIDKSNGATVSVIAGSRLLRPSELPAGWVLLGESGCSVVVPARCEGGGDWSRRYGPEGAVSGYITVWQYFGAMPAERGPWKAAGPIRELGSDATLLVQEAGAGRLLSITWETDGGRVFVEASGPASETTERDLIAFAKRLSYAPQP